MTALNNLLLQDINQLLEDAGGPVLFKSLIGALRRSRRTTLEYPESDRRWRGFREWVFERELREAGYHFGHRRYSSGNAIYIWIEPFSEVIDTRGITRKVHSV